MPFFYIQIKGSSSDLNLTISFNEVFSRTAKRFDKLEIFNNIMTLVSLDQNVFQNVS